MTCKTKNIDWIQGYLEGIGAVSTVYGRDVNAEFCLVEIPSEDSPMKTILSLNKDWEGRYLKEIVYRLTRLDMHEFQSKIDEAMKSYQFDILSDVARMSNKNYIDLKMTLEDLHKNKIDFLSTSFCGYLEQLAEANSEYYHFFLENYVKNPDTPSQYEFGEIGNEFLIYGKGRSYYVGLLLPD